MQNNFDVYVENAANNAANPNPTNPEQATRIYQRFDGEESSDKGEKKLYYLVPASASASAPPQFIRQVNPFQAIPSVRPVFAAAPAAAPFDAKSAFVLQPVSLRGDFKSIEQPKAEMLAQPTFVVSPASIRAALNQPEGQQQQQQTMASGIPLQLRSGLAEEESPKPQPDQQPQQQLQQIPQNDRQLNVLQQQIGQAQVQQSQRMWNEQQQQQQQFLQQQQQQIQSQVQQNERLWSEAQLQQQQPLAQAQISERFSNEQQQQPASAQIAQSERLWNANPEDRQPEPAPQPENPPSNSAPVNAQAKSNNADSNSIAASPESFDKRDEEQKKPEDDNKQNKNEIRRADDASIAQAKPNGLSLAGAGGVASSAPHATALVGKDGLALTAPSATAVAGDFGSLGAAGILSNNGK